MLEQLLFTLLILSLMLWVGGAVTGQIWMFRARTLGDDAFAAKVVPYVNWIIRRVYIPAAATAFTSGMLLVWLKELSVTSPWLIFLISVFLATIVVGSVYSLPEYNRLENIAQQDPSNQMLHRRLNRAAWVNRVELTLVLVGVVGVFNGIVFPAVS